MPDSTLENNSPQRVRGVLFDLGGTLFGYGTRSQVSQANVTVLERLGLDPADPEVRRARREASAEVQSEYARQPSFLHRDLFRDAVARTAQRLGVDASREVLDWFEAENRQNIIEHLLPREDAASTLRDLGELGLYRAVVSNADDDWLEPLIRRHRLDDHLEHWTSSEEADSCKPDAGIFRYSLRKAGLEVEEVLFVGDSLQHDVAGAHAIGLRSVLIGEPGVSAPLAEGLDAPASPDYEITRLTELIDIIAGLNEG
jgi:HAD superfamily hydrolase (TIGR01509 family)